MSKKSTYWFEPPKTLEEAAVRAASLDAEIRSMRAQLDEAAEEGVSPRGDYYDTAEYDEWRDGCKRACRAKERHREIVLAWIRNYQSVMSIGALADAANGGAP